MSTLEIIHSKIEEGYRLAKDPDRRPLLSSALGLVEAAAAARTHTTLNAAQVGALHTWLQYHDAAQALGLREAAKAVAAPPRNVVRGAFGRPHPDLDPRITG